MWNTLSRLQINGAIREDWYRAMAKTAADGLPQVDVLEKLRANFKKNRHPLGNLIEEILRRMRGGVGSTSRTHTRTVGSELAGMVPEEEALMIQSGEACGRISDGFINAAEFIVSTGRLRSAIIASLTKPLIYFAALIGLFLFFSFKLLPSFAKARPRHMWPPEAAALGWVADHILLLVGGVIGFGVLTALIVAYLSRNWVSSSRDFADRYIPPFNVIAQMRAATFIGSLAGFISAGVPFSEAIATIRKSGNAYTRHQCDRVQNWIRNSKTPSECLLLLPMVHPRYHWIIDVYSMSSDASQAYKDISKEMLDRTIRSISLVFGGLISNFFLILMAGCVMWIYFSMFAIADVKH